VARVPIFSAPLISAFLLVIAGCDLLEEKPSASLEVRFTLKLKAVDEADHPVSGAQVKLGETNKGETDSEGVVLVTLSGQPGRVAPLMVKCPSGFASPEKSVDVGLTRLAPGSPVPEFRARCTALLRSIVIGLRAENGAGLPLMYLGKEIARTDASGVAHAVLSVPPNETASVQLDTSGAPALKPQNPSLLFKAGNRDEMVLLEQKFTITQKRVVTKPVQRPKPL